MKVLFIGFGSIAQRHFQALKDLRPDVSVYALKSGSQSSGIPSITDIYNWSDIPSDLSFAIVSNPTYKHTEALTKLIAFNIPLFIEKPLSHTLEGLENIEKEIIKKKLITYVACNLRFLPVLEYLKNELLSRISIQEVSIYCGSYLPNWRTEKNYKEIYSANKEMGGGVHLDLFHELDYTCWLFGMPDQSLNVLRSNSSLNITAVDYAFYQFVYPHFVSAITLNYYRPVPKRSLEIVTNKRIYSVDLLNNTVTDDLGNSIFADPVFTINDTYTRQMQYFLNILDNQSQSFNTFSESLKVLKICLKGNEVK